MKEILNKFNAGDPISDSELKALITHYSVLIEELDHHGEIFALVANSCRHDLETLESYKRARQRH